MNENEEIRSTQQTSNYCDYSIKGTKYNLEENMFIDDMCASFSIGFQKQLNDREFYKIKSLDKKLKHLLEFQQYDFLRYELDKLLMNNTRDLLLYGTAYVEIIYWFDNEDNLVKISFKPFRFRHQFIYGNKIFYRVKKVEGSIEKGVVNVDNVITFKMKDLGYPKHYLKNKMNKLRKINLPDINLTLDSNSGFDWSIYNQKQEYKLLRVMKNIYWNGRNYSNQYVTEPYQLYRTMKFNLFRKEILDYLLKKYNSILKEIGEKYNFSGEIIYESNLDDYNNLIEDLRSGRKNCKQVSDEIFIF